MFTMEELLPLIEQTLASNQLFPLPVTGVSMMPTLKGGRDRVFLDRAEFPLRKRSLPLYRRDDGHFILHRIISAQPDGTYTCCGDHQWRKEPGVREDQIIALVVGFERKGKQYSVKHPGYRLWVWFWTACMPIRHFIFALQSRRKRLFKHLFGSKRAG